MWPPPAPKVDPAQVAAAAAAAVVKEPPPPPNYFNITLKDSFMYTTGLTTVVGKLCFYMLTIHNLFFFVAVLKHFYQNKEKFLKCIFMKNNEIPPKMHF